MFTREMKHFPYNFKRLRKVQTTKKQVGSIANQCFDSFPVFGCEREHAYIHAVLYSVISLGGGKVKVSRNVGWWSKPMT